MRENMAEETALRLWQTRYLRLSNVCTFVAPLRAVSMGQALGGTSVRQLSADIHSSVKSIVSHILQAVGDDQRSFVPEY